MEITDSNLIGTFFITQTLTTVCVCIFFIRERSSIPNHYARNLVIFFGVIPAIFGIGIGIFMFIHADKNAILLITSFSLLEFTSGLILSKLKQQ